MLSINKNLLIVISCLGIFGCSSSSLYNNSFIPGRISTENNPFGSYIEVSAKDSLYKGEYIAYNSDTLYVMTYNDLVKLHKNEFRSLKIILTKNYGKTYLIGTGIALIPSLLGTIIHPDYRGGFLTIGLIPLVFGSLATIIESKRTPTIISYPNHSPDLLMTTKYARFPSGFPEWLNVDLLKKACRPPCRETTRH